MRRWTLTCAIAYTVIGSAVCANAQTKASGENLESLSSRFKERRSEIKSGQLEYWRLYEIEPLPLTPSELQSIVSELAASPTQEAFRDAVARIAREGSPHRAEALSGPSSFEFDGSGRSHHRHGAYDEWQSLDGPIVRYPEMQVSTGAVRRQYDIGSEATPIKVMSLDDFHFFPNLSLYAKADIREKLPKDTLYELSSSTAASANLQVDARSGALSRWWISHPNGEIRRERWQFKYKNFNRIPFPSVSYDAQYDSTGKLDWCQIVFLEHVVLNSDVSKLVEPPAAAKGDVVVDYRSSPRQVRRVNSAGLVTSQAISSPFPAIEHPTSGSLSGWTGLFALVMTAVVIALLVAVVRKHMI